MSRVARGRLLVVVGGVLLVATLAVSAVTAPTIGETALASETNRTLVGVQGGGPQWHDYGTVSLVNGTDVAWRENSADSYFDVTATENGTVLAAFADGGYEDCGPVAAPCTRTGYRRIEPGLGAYVDSEYSFPVASQSNSEVHDAEPLPGGGVVFADMDRERIVVVRNGSVAWQWSARDHYEAPPDPTTTDWLHLNDVDVIEPGRYLVSVRNANQLLVVERGAGVTQVINEDENDADDGNCREHNGLVDADGDGDVRCGDPTVLDHQHNPQWLSADAILVADSGNNRVVELHRTADGDWEPAWALTRANGVDLAWPRDADRLPNGNTLVTDTLNRRVVEVDEDGEVVWSVRLGRVPYEAERLPAGETVGAPTYARSDWRTRLPRDVPVLSTLLIGLRAVVPATPFWFREPQLGLSLLSVGLVTVGTVESLRGGG
jgi:hypothetical protein